MMQLYFILLPENTSLVCSVVAEEQTYVFPFLNVDVEEAYMTLFTCVVNVCIHLVICLP